MLQRYYILYYFGRPLYSSSSRRRCWLAQCTVQCNSSAYFVEKSLVYVISGYAIVLVHSDQTSGYYKKVPFSLVYTLLFKPCDDCQEKYIQVFGTPIVGMDLTQQNILLRNYLANSCLSVTGTLPCLGTKSHILPS